MAEFGDDGLKDLYWPDEQSMEEVVTALRNYDGKRSDFTLNCDFDDETMDTSQELQEAIMNFMDSDPIFLMSLSIFNSCNNGEKKERCFDFFLRHLKLGNAFAVSYTDHIRPWTLVEAQQAAAVIPRSNDGSTELTLVGNIFAVEGTFECVFNAIIDGGIIHEFVVQAETFPDLNLGCIGRSNLANNTALERFSLEVWEDDMFVADEGIEQLANALKSNRGLEEIIITRGMMTNAGRIHLLESLRDNTTLSKLDTRAIPMALSPNNDVNEDELLLKEGGIEGRLLQSHFDRHMKLNRFWKRLKKRCNIDNNKNDDSDREDDDDDDDDDDKNEEKYLGRRSISMEILPDVLEILAKKPLLLYTFIREEDHTQLFGTLYDRPLHSTQRRSERLCKKRRIERRIAAPGGKY